MDRTARRPHHYPSRAAERADLAVHIVGLILACLGGAVMIAIASGLGVPSVLAVAIYACGFVLMLSFSLAYNFSDGRRRVLRRLDHAGIFLMIAGSYTPFTTLALKGGWAWSMTTAVWSVAGLGILCKLLLPHMRDGLSTALYLALGWIILIAIGPIGKVLPRSAIILLVIGGLLYSFGVVFHFKDHLQFSRSIWHGHVVAGAIAHWVAILVGAVLPAASR